MAFTAIGLNHGGVTTHYKFQYDDSLAAPLNPSGPEPDRTNAVIDACESDFNLMQGWFGNIPLNSNFNFPIPVSVTQNDGGAVTTTSHRDVTITINPDPFDASFVRYLLVAEVVELFMKAQGRGWFGSHSEGSEGEGLSLFLAAQFLAINGFGDPTGGSHSNKWLSSDSRPDFVNFTDPTDNKPGPKSGCALLFIYYLFAQLGFSIYAIVAAGAPTLGGVYKNLTADPSDPFPIFRQLLDTAFPGTSTITEGNLDNPFPLPSAAMLSTLQYLRKDAPGKNAIRDLIASKNVGNLRALLNSDRSASLVR